MRINHNIASLNTYRQLSANGVNTQKSLEKLSSGLRINRAGDDAAGLAISEKMRGQIRGLDQASRNSQDAISLIQTAEGALNETHSILQRMRELSVQAANDTNTDTDRGEIQKEMTQLTSEINRIGNTTEFNTKKLLDGSISTSAKSSGAFAAGGTGLTGITLAGGSTLANGNYTIDVTATTGKSGTNTTNAGGISGITVASGATIGAGTGYQIDVTSSTVKTGAVGTLDNGVTGVSVASNSTLAAGNYTIDVTRTDAASAISTNGSNVTGVTYTATSAAGDTGAFTLDVTATASGLTNTSGVAGVITGVSITDQTAWATFAKGGDDLLIKNSGTDGQLALYSKDGSTKLSDSLILDNNTQTYKIYNGGTYTGLTISTNLNAASDFEIADNTQFTFDVDSTLTLKQGATTVGTATVAAGAAAGTATINGANGDFAITYGANTAVAATGALNATALVGNKTETFNVTNTLSAQLKDSLAANVGGPVTFTAGSTVNLPNGAAFTSSATLGNYSATAAESSTFTVASAVSYTATLKDSGGSQVGGTSQITLLNNVNSVSFGNGVSFNVGTAAVGTATFDVVAGTTTYSGALKDSSGATIATKALTTDSIADFGNGLKVNTGATLTTNTAAFSVSSSADGSLTMQVGANQGQSFSMNVADMRSASLKISSSTGADAFKNVDGTAIVGAAWTSTNNVTNGTDNNPAEYALDVSDATKASAAIKVIDNATTSVSAERSKLGAYQNRLEHTINNLGTSSENLTAAESRVRDVDMAKEMMEFTKNNILSQAAQAMLAQANQQPQGVLQLLR